MPPARMEYLEGESLAERLEKGPLPAAQVLQYGTQIASALDKAHRNGVTPRDLKPGNIILTKTGAKLLDFGLAKAEPSASMGKTLTDATPRPLPMTKMGAIIGTVPYMSPEQLEGKEVDARSDIFSLGAVLYEMVTGNRAFQGQSEFSVASAILHKDPAPISTLQPLTPPALERTIRVCLAKDAEMPHAATNAASRSDTHISVLATSDNTPQVFAVRSDYPEPQPIGPRGMTLLAVSSKGELAVLLNAHYLWYRLFTGTLARMTLGGGAPREIQEGVRQADWSPDGTQLAIIREVAGKDRLEYPIGHVLREVSGSLSDVRFSPKGDRIAQHYMLLQGNLIYTGITRGKKLVVLIWQEKALGHRGTQRPAAAAPTYTEGAMDSMGSTIRCF